MAEVLESDKASSGFPPEKKKKKCPATSENPQIFANIGVSCGILMTALLDTKDAGTSSNKARDNEPESLRAVNVVAAQPFAFVSLMLENSIISNTWSNITWHRGLTCISQLVYQKCLVYENDLYFHKSIDIE